MQELRFVLIMVGALAIAALLFHGLWTSKKEGKSKFGHKPLRKIDTASEQPTAPSSAAADEFEIIRKPRKEPDFGLSKGSADPLIADFPSSDELPESAAESAAIEANYYRQSVPVASATSTLSEPEPVVHTVIASESPTQPSPQIEPSPQEEPLDVIVLNVHCAGNQQFVGTKLFDSMQQNGLLFGEMDIFHRHADLSGTGKVLFSVANMMQPGTLMHDEPADFTTQGISFFMTLPGFGDPEQNFKLMLKTAQQIADDLSGHVLDDARNLMTPNRLDAYRKQIQDFKAKARTTHA